MEATKVLTVIAVIAVVVAALGLGTNFFLLDKIQSVGYASTEYGNATLTLQGTANINFSRSLINWSTGQVNTTGSCANAGATLDTDGPNLCAINFQTVSQGLLLDNIGGINVSVRIMSNNNATTFIGGTIPVLPAYEWKGSNALAGSCNTTVTPSTYTAVNTTSPGTLLCPSLGNTAEGYNNRLEIDLRVVIPQNSPPVPKNSQITAVATVVI